MKNKTLLTLCAASMLLSVNAMAQKGDTPTNWGSASFTYTVNGSTPEYDFTINDNCTESYAFNGFSGTSEKTVKSITYNRTFTANTPSTIALPFSLPAGTTINAKFYSLEYVIPDLRDGKRTWLAKMKKIDGLPQVNRPYVVVVPEGGTLTFDLKGAYAEFAPTTTPANFKVTSTQYDYDSKNELHLDYDPNDNAGDWYFIGTKGYKVWDNSDDETGRCYGFEGSSSGDLAQGKFGKIVSGTTGGALRAYLCKKDNSIRLLGKQSANGTSMFSLPESINVELVDTDASGKEHTTYVGKLNRIDNVRLNRERSTFDLKGRNVDGKNMAKGVYLKK